MRKLLALLSAFASPALAQTPAGVINAPIYATGYISQVGGTNVTTNIPPQPNHPTNLNIYTTGTISGTWTIKLPNPAFEGQMLSFNCGAAANTISITSSDGSSIDSTLPTACLINSGFTIQFDQRSNIWRNIGSNNTSTFKPFTGVTSQWPWQLNTDGTWTLKQPDAADVTFTQTGTGAVQTTLDARTKLQAIYLEDFGAAGSSGSADATAFTNAIAACSAAGGCVLTAKAARTYIPNACGYSVNFDNFVMDLPVGTVIKPSTSSACTFLTVNGAYYASTTLSANLAASATSATVASTTGMTAGNLIQFDVTRTQKGTSTTSVTIGTGSKTWTVTENSANQAAFHIGQYVTFSDGSGNTASGLITAYSVGSMTVNVTTTTGSGTKTSWTVTDPKVDGTPFAFVSVITGRVGSVVSFSDPVPPTLSINTNESATVIAGVPRKNVRLSGFTLDGSNATSSATAVGVSMAVVQDSGVDIKTVNWATSAPTTGAGSAFLLVGSYGGRFNVVDDGSGSNNNAAVWFSKITNAYCSATARNGYGFGVQLSYAAYNTCVDLVGVGQQYRGVKLQGAIANNLFGVVGNNNGLAAGYAGVTLSLGSSYNVLTGVVANNNYGSVSGNRMGLWFSDQYNLNNTINGLTAYNNGDYELYVGASDTANTINNAAFGNYTHVLNIGCARINGMNNSADVWDYQTTGTTTCTGGLTWTLSRHDGAAAAFGNIASMSVRGSNNVGGDLEFGRFDWLSASVTPGSETGQLNIALANSGTVAARYNFAPTAFAPAATATSDLGAASYAFRDAYLSGSVKFSTGSTFTLTGNYSFTGALTGATSITFPTSGTLATLGANTFTAGQVVNAGPSVPLNISADSYYYMQLSANGNSGQTGLNLITKDGSGTDYNGFWFQTASGMIFQGPYQGTIQFGTSSTTAGGSTVSMLTLNYASNAVFNFGITVASTTLLTTSVSLANGAAAAAGTLTNAPAAGNPTKWIPINDNGTTRYIPAW